MAISLDQLLRRCDSEIDNALRARNYHSWRDWRSARKSLCNEARKYGPVHGVTSFFKLQAISVIHCHNVGAGRTLVDLLKPHYEREEKRRLDLLAKLSREVRERLDISDLSEMSLYLRDLAGVE